MAQLPRYKAPRPTPQTGGGMAQRATAQMFGTLGDRIDQFAGMAIQRAGEEAKIKGIEEGFAAGASGEFTPEDKLTIYGRAYNNSALTAYTAQSSVASKNKAVELAIEYQDNPQGFQEVYGAYAKEIISTAPTEEIQYIMKKQFDTYGGAAYNKLLVDKQKTIRKNEQKSYEGYAAVLTEDYRASILAGDEGKSTEILANLISLQGSAINSGFVSEGEVTQYNRNLMADGYKDKILSEFDGSSEAMSKFRKGTHSLLTLEDKQEVEKQMINRIRDDNSIVKMEESQETADNEANRKEVVEGFTGLMLDKNLRQTDIDEAYRTGDINKADYNYFNEQIASKGIKYDDADTILKMIAYPADFSKEDILNSPSISFETKVKLMKDKMRYLENEGKWTSTIEGVEARARVKRHFGILSDTLMAQMDFTGQNAKDFDKTYRSFYDKVSMLPPEERAVASLRIADEAIDEYNGIIATRKETMKVKREDRNKAKEQEKIDTYKDSITGKFMNSLGSFGIFEGDTDALE